MKTPNQEDIRFLIDLVGREGAIAALSKSAKITQESLTECATLLGLPQVSKESKVAVVTRLVRFLDKRITKTIDELKNMSKDDLVRYFNNSGCDRDDLIELLLAIDLKSRAMSQRAMVDFAATQLSSLGIYERLSEGKPRGIGENLTGSESMSASTENQGDKSGNPVKNEPGLRSHDGGRDRHHGS